MIRIGLLGMMIGLGIIFGHPGMRLLLHHHLHFKRARTKLRLLVSAVTTGPPPGIERTSSPRGNTSRSKSLLMAAMTLGTDSVGYSVLVGPVLTPTCEISGNSSCNFETLETVGLKRVNLPDFEDRFIDKRLTVAPTA